MALLAVARFLLNFALQLMASGAAGSRAAFTFHLVVHGLQSGAFVEISIHRMTGYSCAVGAVGPSPCGE